MSKPIEKRFPASVDLTYKTFLNDKKINGELYAFFQSISKGVEQETVVFKKDMPTQAIICSVLGIKSPKTYRAHLNYLLETGYLEERENEKDRYYLPRLEESYFQFPLPTIQFLLDTATDNVIKVYIYLGQRYKYGQSRGIDFEFSLEDIAAHIGLKLNNNQREYIMLNNVLDCLQNNGLITYVSYYDGKMPKKKLTGFSYTHKAIG